MIVFVDGMQERFYNGLEFRTLYYLHSDNHDIMFSFEGQIIEIFSFEIYSLFPSPSVLIRKIVQTHFFYVRRENSRGNLVIVLEEIKMRHTILSLLIQVLWVKVLSKFTLMHTRLRLT